MLGFFLLAPSYGDVDMVGTPDLVLQEGDRVRVVAPTGRMAEISKFFGDSARGLSSINPVALGVGMALGNISLLADQYYLVLCPCDSCI